MLVSDNADDFDDIDVDYGDASEGDVMYDDDAGCFVILSISKKQNSL